MREFNPNAVKLGRGTKAIIAISVALFVDSLLYSAVVPILPIYARSLGASSGQVGVLFASYAIGLILAAPLLAWYSDHRTRKPPLLVGAAILVMATLSYTFAQSYTQLIVSRFLQGMAASAVWTAGIALVAELVPKATLGRSMGVVMAAMSGGLMAGPILGGVLSQFGGHRAPFVVLIPLTLCSLVIQFRWISEPQRNGEPPVSIISLLVAPMLRSTTLAVLLASSGLSMLEPLLPIQLNALGVDSVIIGLIFGIATLTSAAVSPLIGILVDRCNPNRIIPFGLLSTGATMAMLSLTRSVFATSFVLIIFAAAYSLVLVPALPQMAHIAEDLAGNAYAAIYTVFNLAYSGGMIIGPVIGGWGAEYSSQSTLLITGLALTIYGFVTTLISHHPRQAHIL